MEKARLNFPTAIISRRSFTTRLTKFTPTFSINWLRRSLIICGKKKYAHGSHRGFATRRCVRIADTAGRGWRLSRARKLRLLINEDHSTKKERSEIRAALCEVQEVVRNCRIYT